MTVQELIKELQQFPADLEVLYSGPYEDFKVEYLGVGQTYDNKKYVKIS